MLPLWSVLCCDNFLNEFVLQDEKMAFEPTLLAVLIRLMTYLVPRVHLIQEHDGNIASRFCSMTRCMLKLSNYHPGVVMEGLSFFESLLSHKNLLRIKALSIPGTEHPDIMLLTLSKHIVELSKPKSCVSAIGSFQARGMNILLAAVRAYCALLQFPKTDTLKYMDDYNVASDLIETLELTFGSVTFPLCHMYRDMAFYHMVENLDLVLDLRLAIDLACQLKTRSNTSISRIIIICRAVLQGDDEACETDMKSEVSSEIHGSFRWQIRYLIAQLMRDFIKNIGCDDNNLLVHSKWLISTACTLSVSTSDQSELYSLQKAGIDMIHTLLEHVNHNKSLRNSFEENITQILPSVRQALSYTSVDDDESIDKEGARLVHLSGCKCLSFLYNRGMIHDVLTFKRLTKMLFPFIESFAFSSYPEEEEDGVISPHLKPKSFVDDRTSILLPRISSLFALSRIYVTTLVDPVLKKLFLEVADDDISKMDNGIVSMSAALAIDGCRLKMHIESPDEVELLSGLTFHNVQDIDTVTKNVLIESCVFLASFSVIISISRLAKLSRESSDYMRLMFWTKKTISVVQSEFYSSLRILAQNPNDDTTIEAFKNILEALKCAILFRDEQLMSEECICSISKCVFQLLTFPVCGSSVTTLGVKDDLLTEEINTDSVGKSSSCNITEAAPSPGVMQIAAKEILSSDIVTQSCSFIEAVCSSKCTRTMITDVLLEELVRPLLVMEKTPDISLLDDPVNFTIFESSLRGLVSILSESSGFENIIKSLLGFGIQTYQLRYKTTDVPESLSELIKFCLSSNAISMKEKSLHATNAAKIGNWGLWELCVGDNLSLISDTIAHMTNAIADHENAERHLSALLVASESLKRNANMIPLFMGHVGPHMLELYHLYGINEISGQDRTLVCATCTKIIMLAYQHLSSSNAEEEDMIMFLITIVDVLTSIVSYNGLPNQEVFNNGSDSSLGRMCAQVFVHVLRASPSIFKACMCRLKEEVKLILESTVRADMAGYPSKEPVKKKLNLESYRRV